jgi:hypothetical protein
MSFTFNQMGINKRVNPYPGGIHTSSPRGGFAVYAAPSPSLGGGFVVRSGGPVIATPSLPVVVTFSSDSTRTVTRKGHYNGRSRDFTVTRTATGKSGTSAQRAKAKADQLAYDLASKEADRQARVWKAHERQKDAARQPASGFVRPSVVQQPVVFLGPRLVQSGKNPHAWGVAPNGEVITVYGTGRPGSWVGQL